MYVFFHTLFALPLSWHRRPLLSTLSIIFFRFALLRSSSCVCVCVFFLHSRNVLCLSPLPYEINSLDTSSFTFSTSSYFLFAIYKIYNETTKKIHKIISSKTIREPPNSALIRPLNTSKCVSVCFYYIFFSFFLSSFVLSNATAIKSLFFAHSHIQTRNQSVSRWGRNHKKPKYFKI